MSRKALNAANLERLGPGRLAGLVMDLVQGSAALQRRARMELSAAQGSAEVAADIRKRLVTLRRSTGRLSGRRQTALVKDLDGLLAMIAASIAPQDADEAVGLLWSILHLSPAIQARGKDPKGAIAAVMRKAVGLIATLAPRIATPPDALAGQILDLVADAGPDAVDGLVPALADALGDDGLAHLRNIAQGWAGLSPGASAPPEGVPATDRARRRLAGSALLADIADAQGDVDAYMVRYCGAQLTHAVIATEVARRLLKAGRTTEALDIATRARAARTGQPADDDLDAVLEDCLDRLGRHDDLARHLWDGFSRTLNARSLRAYLKLLPDFDDIEAEDRALDLAEAHPDPGRGVAFLLGWNRPDRAARMVLARSAQLDGNAHDMLSAAADALDGDHPLAATLLRRAMIDDCLNAARSTRYRHAARQLAGCRALDARISDYGEIADHAQYLARLGRRHARKRGFWQRVAD